MSDSTAIDCIDASLYCMLLKMDYKHNTVTKSYGCISFTVATRITLQVKLTAESSEHAESSQFEGYYLYDHLSHK